MSLETLVEISRSYGKNPDYVLAGGGNTSWKNNETLYVKGSGMPLSDVEPASFVKMDRNALSRIWEKRYPESSVERESAVLADMMAARMPGEEAKRPSVETLLHGILPFSYVVHLHPALVNGLTCSRRGGDAVRELFAEDVIWITISNPGYVLSQKVKTAMDAFSVKKGKTPSIIFLQNHGVFVGADNIDAINEQYSRIMSKIGGVIKRHPDFSDEKRISGKEFADRDSASLQILTELAGTAAFMRSAEILSLVKNRASFAPVSSAFTPDHIVYAGSNPLFVEIADREEKLSEAAYWKEALGKAWKEHAQKIGRNPKTVAVQGIGVFGAGPTEKAANLALELFKNAVKVAVYAESFGGPQFMTQEQIDFINSWEVERFRTSVSAK